MDGKHLEELLLKAAKKENPGLADRYDQFLRDFRRYEARFHGRDPIRRRQTFRKDDKI